MVDPQDQAVDHLLPEEVEVCLLACLAVERWHQEFISRGETLLEWILVECGLHTTVDVKGASKYNSSMVQRRTTWSRTQVTSSRGVPGRGGILSCTTKDQSQLCAKMVQSWVSQQRDKCPLRNLVLQWCHGSFAAHLVP